MKDNLLHIFNKHKHWTTIQNIFACRISLTLWLCIGAVDFLQKPVTAFVRLQDSVVMDGIIEASVPVRFIFALVGPTESGIDFHESGRAMGTLLADWVREEVVKKHY